MSKKHNLHVVTGSLSSRPLLLFSMSEGLGCRPPVWKLCLSVQGPDVPPAALPGFFSSRLLSVYWVGGQVDRQLELWTDGQ